MVKTPKTPPKLPEVRIRKAMPVGRHGGTRKAKKEKVAGEFSEQVVQIDRVARVVAGGKRLRFRAVVVVGNQADKVGLGVEKANDVATAVQKAVKVAKKNLISVPIKNETIPHEILQSFGSAKVLLKPAPKGTGIIAGGPIRVIANLAGIKNISAKILGSSNKMNNLKATILALEKLRRTPWQVRNKPFDPAQDKGTK